MKKRIIALIMATTIICGSGLSVSAATHNHAYSNMGSVCYNSGLLYSHTYYSNGENKSCNVIGLYYRDSYRCACGASYYDNYRTIPKHTALCGE